MLTRALVVLESTVVHESSGSGVLSAWTAAIVGSERRKATMGMIFMINACFLNDSRGRIPGSVHLLMYYPPPPRGNCKHGMCLWRIEIRRITPQFHGISLPCLLKRL